MAECRPPDRVPPERDGGDLTLTRGNGPRGTLGLRFGLAVGALLSAGLALGCGDDRDVPRSPDGSSPRYEAARATDAIAPHLPSGTAPLTAGCGEARPRSGDAERGLVWGVGQKLTSPEPFPGETMGTDVAIAGDWLLVGATWNENIVRPGTVYAFGRQDGRWSFAQSLQAPAPADGDGFGVAIDLDSTSESALVGSCADVFYTLPEPSQRGTVYEFRRTDATWSLTGTLEPDGPIQIDDAFGCALGRDGEVVAVGAPRDDEAATGGGAVYVFVVEGEGWSFAQKLTASDALTGDQFGAAVALQEGTLFVGAVGYEAAAGKTGAVYTYRWNGGLFGEEQKLVPDDGGPYDRFGAALAVWGDRAAVGARNHTDPSHEERSGAVYGYARSDSLWSLQAKLLPNEDRPDLNFGTSVALQSDTLLVGAPDWVYAETPGMVYVYGLSPSQWTLDRTLVSPSLGNGAGMGDRLAVDHEQAIAGAKRSIEQGTLVAAGAAVVLERSRHATGDPCSNGDQCDSSYCVEGVCCNEACGHGAADACLACTSARGAPADGICGPVTDGTACDDGEFCTAEDRCISAVCVGGPSPCPGPNDNDDCAESCDELTKSCTAYDGEFAACLEGACVDGSCLKDDGGACSFGIECASGHCVDRLCCVEPSCGGYRCQTGGACATRCESTADCAAGFQCSSSGQCRSAEPETQNSGCSLHGAGSVRGTGRLGHLALVAWLVLLGARAGRRRRARALATACVLLAPSAMGCAPEPEAGHPTGEPSAGVGQTANALIWARREKLEADVPLQWSLLGTAVASEERTIAAGAPMNPFVEFSGKVHLFRADDEGVWTEQQVVERSDAANQDYFGISIALREPEMLVGSAWDDEMLFAGQPGGAAHLFVRAGDEFVEAQRLVATGVSDTDDFGMTVALGPDVALVGAPRSDHPTAGGNAGAVYPFERGASGFEPTGALWASDAEQGALFGHAMALDGDRLLVGARRAAAATASRAGAAYVWERTGSAWTESARLEAPDPAQGDAFGYAVALRGDVAAVGAPRCDEREEDAGAVYLFVRSGDTWSLERELRPVEAEPGDMFGASLVFSSDGRILGVGATMAKRLFEEFIPAAGKVYVFERTGSDWAEVAQLQSQEQSEDGSPAAVQLGMSLALGPAGLVAGAPAAPASNSTSPGMTPGAAYLFALARANGDPCSADGDCASGHCVDEICCDSPCGGELPSRCRVCSVDKGAIADGTCTDLADGTRCDDGAYCNGGDWCLGGECTEHEGYPCLGRHDGDDDCSESCSEVDRSCSAPDDDNVACDNGRCRAGICARNPGAACASDLECRFQSCVDGVCCIASDCSPFRCGPQGTCLQSCQSASDCVAGYECVSTGACIAAGASTAAAGCSCRLNGTRRPSNGRAWLWLAGCLPAVALARRRAAAPGEGASS